MAVAQGCAFGTRTVSLNPVTVPGQSSAGARQTVYVLPAQDLRDDKSSVGCVRNGFGMRTAEVVANSDVARWIQQSVASSLTASGYEVREGAPPDATNALSVAVSVNKVFCNSYMHYGADVSLSCEVRRGDRAVDKFDVQGTAAAINWAGTASGFQRTLHAALRNCLTQMMPKLDSALRSAKPA
jgi:uncharacterized lipoprotein YajG